MTHILTLVASTPDITMGDHHFARAADLLKTYNTELCTRTPVTLCPEKAAETTVTGDITMEAMIALRTLFAADKIDVFATSHDNRRKKLLLADMDSTIATTETLDELAAFAGIKEQIAAITTRAMNGDLDFHSALRERVGLLKGLSADTLAETLADTALTQGATTFVQTMVHHGAKAALVSGGFTYFTQAIGDQCGFHYNHGNVLIIEDGKLTGEVGEPIQDKHSKVAHLDHYSTQHGLSAADCLTIGDGANDIPMLQKAGLGIGFHAKDTVRDTILNCIIHGDLTAALYAQGYRYDEFAK